MDMGRGNFKGTKSSRGETEKNSSRGQVAHACLRLASWSAAARGFCMSLLSCGLGRSSPETVTVYTDPAQTNYERKGILIGNVKQYACTASVIAGPLRPFVSATLRIGKATLRNSSSITMLLVISSRSPARTQSQYHHHQWCGMAVFP